MKKLSYYLFTFLILSKLLNAQSAWDSFNLPSSQNYTITDIKFIDGNTGFVIAVQPSAPGYAMFYKTTNKGYNWCIIAPALYSTEITNANLDFADANTGIISRLGEFNITQNGGANFIGLSPFHSDFITDSKLIMIDNGTAYAPSVARYTDDWGRKYLEVRFYHITKPYGQWQINYSSYKEYVNVFVNDQDKYYLSDIRKNNINEVLLCGFYQIFNQSVHSVLFKYSTGYQDYYNTNVRNDYVSYLPNTTDYMILSNLGISTTNGVNVPLGYNNSVPHHGLTLINSSTGYAAVNDGKIYKTTNGGLNWEYDNVDIYNSENTELRNKLTNINEIVIYGGCDVENQVKNAKMYIKKLETGVITKFDGVPLNGSVYIDNELKYTNASNPLMYLRGGTVYFQAVDNLQNPQLDNEAIFYKWSDNNSLNPNKSYYFDNSGNTFSANYKSKLKADNPWAISNASQTKSTRDTLGYIHVVQESDEGIFYTRSTDNGSNFNITSFSREEVVNAGPTWNSQFPNDASGFNNYSPSLCETRDLMSGKALATDYPYNSIVACWEHNTGVGQTNGQTQIRVAIRNTEGGDPDWLKYNSSGNTNNDGLIKSFSSNSSFRAKPVIFASCPTSYLNNPYNYLFLIPHLEPSTNGGKLIVTAKYKNKGIYPPNGNTNDFIIADGNVSDFSVTTIPTYHNYIYNGYYLYFVYKQGDDIKYQKELICLGSVGDSTEICRTSYPSESNTISSGDGGWYSRNSVDISLRNGLPVISYAGRYDVERIINYESDASGGGGDELYTLHYFPVRVIYKTTSSGNDWASYVYNSDGVSIQENTNVEGSRNSNAFLLNFSKNNSMFKQFVKIIGSGNYYCCPATFSGTDSKFIDGSYGQFQQSSNPRLLTLTASNLLYSVENHSISISNQPCYDPGIIDGFNNLYGTIDKANITYKYNLGPIIVKNTIQGISDDQPPQTVENAAEFNENMVSSRFLLSDYDTLIIGGYGLYLLNSEGTFRPMQYRADLIKSSNNQVQRTLFIDTVQVSDSLETEFLRGFIIDRIDNGSDSFYVQLIVDTTTLNNTYNTFGLNGVYSDNTEIGDNISGRNKIKVFFENGNNHNQTNFSNLPKSFQLSQNYPNPFNPVTTIKYALPKNEFVTIKIYDIVGREIMRLLNEYKQAGYYSVNFNGSNLASGVYFYRIQAGDFTAMKRMVLVK